MNARAVAIVAVLGLALTACADTDPLGTGVADVAAAASPASPAMSHVPRHSRGPALSLPATGTLSDGGTFEGRLSITEILPGEAGGLVASGVLNGRATTADGRTRGVDQAFRHVPITLEPGGSAAGIGVQQVDGCEIIAIDIGPITIDVLLVNISFSGLMLDISLDSGGLVGTLLCTILGLLG